MLIVNFYIWGGNIMKKVLINIDYINDFVVENGVLICGELG